MRCAQSAATPRHGETNIGLYAGSVSAGRGPGEGARHESKALAAELAPLVRQFLEHEFVTTPGHVAVQAHEHRGKAVPSQLRGVMGKVATERRAPAQQGASGPAPSWDG